jgi:hypothetical protein
LLDALHPVSYAPKGAEEATQQSVAAWQRLQGCLRELADLNDLNKERNLRRAREAESALRVGSRGCSRGWPDESDHGVFYSSRRHGRRFHSISFGSRAHMRSLQSRRPTFRTARSLVLGAGRFDQWPPNGQRFY